MILIADSGSTKTDWRTVDENNHVNKFQTVGLNPFFLDKKSIDKIINKSFCSKLNNEEINKIFFYGSGCASNFNSNTIKESLELFFRNAEVFVFTDLFGAARALFGNKKGIVAILGTGANSACYDGEKITKNITSLGYVLGDEGSGAYLGKIFITDFLKKELPNNLYNKFINEYELSKDNILDSIYSKPFPNRFLASFTNFLFNNKDDEYVINLLEDNFNKFFDKTICKYKNFDNQIIRSVGSIAFHFEDVFKSAALKRNITIDKIIKNPISGLVNYHLEKL